MPFQTTDKLAILTYQNLCWFEFGCAMELFVLPRPEFKHWYNAEVVTFESKPIQALGGVTVSANQITDFSHYHTLVIPGWSERDTDIPAKLKTALLAFLAQGGRVITFCSGAFLLAKCGVLNGLSATTHWRYSDEFKAQFPLINFVNDVLFVQQNNIACSAGSAAALDLGLDIIKQDFGARIANKVAKRLVIPAHRAGGQAQYVETPISTRHEHFAKVLDWAIVNLHHGVLVEDLAKQANMSRRTFDRHFMQKMGMSAKTWLVQQQLHLAKGLLETRQITIEEIAIKTGFGSSLNFRHHFNRELGISPSKYRAQFSFN